MIKLVGEIGINHNGDMENVKKLIDVASISGFQYVKFQKRNPEKCVPCDQKGKKKDTPWGEMTYLEYKKKIELSKADYLRISAYCIEKNMKWFASVWDLDSARFMTEFSSIAKIPSALITDLELIKYCRNNFATLIISTGMSEESEIEKAVAIGKPDVLLHSIASYPTEVDDLNLNYIKWLKDKYPDIEIGYSGHESGISTTLVTIFAGVDWIERHITLDREMWGSDQASSVDPIGMFALVRDVRKIERSIGEYRERSILKSEKEKRRALRK